VSLRESAWEPRVGYIHQLNYCEEVVGERYKRLVAVPSPAFHFERVHHYLLLAMDPLLPVASELSLKAKNRHQVLKTSVEAVSRTAAILSSAKDASPTNTRSSDSSDSSIHTTESGSSHGGSGPVISPSPSCQPRPSITEKSKLELNLPKAINMRDTPLPTLSGRVDIDISVRPLAAGGFSNVYKGRYDGQPVSGQLLAYHL
jgi:hypothetical protein